MKPWIIALVLLVLVPVAGATVFLSWNPRASAADGDVAARVERGRYIVNAFGCTDCHTPLEMTPEGPKPDLARNLSGHPESLVMPPAPTLPEGPWQVVASGTSTAWAGPWGTSFTANLTPDDETGLGQWTEEQFLRTVRTGRHLGMGRAILPPMPIQQLAQMTDDDLRAIFAYLKSLPPTKNRVPEPIPPAAGPAR